MQYDLWWSEYDLWRQIEMTKKAELGVDDLKDNEISQILKNSVEIYDRDLKRAQELVDIATAKLDYAKMRLDTYTKTGKLLPVEEAK